ncbi:hypothetical protein PIB30_105212, partial [Stylosanthes scabra]|nr:hypothetical protein [Stylosanthes scabra]
ILGLILVMKVVECLLNNMSLTQGHLIIWVEIYKGKKKNKHLLLKLKNNKKLKPVLPSNLQ